MCHVTEMVSTFVAMLGWPWSTDKPLASGLGARVTLQTSLGVHVTVSAVDGVMRLGGNSSGPEAFNVVQIAPSTVALLRGRVSEVIIEAEGSRPQMTTRSGCRCNGFSNAYGFGDHCAAWEEDFQAPWCYVDDECAAVTSKGSFGLKSQRCDTEAPAYTDYNDNYAPSTAYAPLGGWRAPEGCACSGFSNKHGYGSSCKAWEEQQAPGQTPWCYTYANCSSIGVRKGSFGRPHVECEPWYEQLPPATSPPPPSPPPPPPPPPPPSPPKLTRKQKQQRRAAAHEVAAKVLEDTASQAAQYASHSCHTQSSQHASMSASSLPQLTSSTAHLFHSSSRCPLLI